MKRNVSGCTWSTTRHRVGEQNVNQAVQLQQQIVTCPAKLQLRIVKCSAKLQQQKKSSVQCEGAGKQLVGTGNDDKGITLDRHLLCHCTGAGSSLFKSNTLKRGSCDLLAA